jgi:hypothetical protein
MEHMYVYLVSSFLHFNTAILVRLPAPASTSFIVLGELLFMCSDALDEKKIVTVFGCGNSRPARSGTIKQAFKVPLKCQE